MEWIIRDDRKFYLEPGQNFFVIDGIAAALAVQSERRQALDQARLHHARNNGVSALAKKYDAKDEVEPLELVAPKSSLGMGDLVKPSTAKARPTGAPGVGQGSGPQNPAAAKHGAGQGALRLQKAVPGKAPSGNGTAKQAAATPGATKGSGPDGRAPCWRRSGTAETAEHKGAGRSRYASAVPPAFDALSYQGGLFRISPNCRRRRCNGGPTGNARWHRSLYDSSRGRRGWTGAVRRVTVRANSNTCWIR
ncbi:hypothetical protein [Breoghania sp.]|uniref:hypothetical protein n=1 Tax=Breoghania sp. TaxID=2065378 RepID=UPI002610D5BC|nr:hypothetical protein [Breoghania sp.]MDJ0932888.1 hypothetical protein [Breoghania sp.]